MQRSSRRLLMLSLSLSLSTAMAGVPALSQPLPHLPPGWAFVTFDGFYLTTGQHYLVAEVDTP
jgi:hypothetical protein